MFKRLIRWILAEYRAYLTECLIERVAKRLGICDFGSTEVWKGEEEGNDLIHIHSQCATPLRKGITMLLSQRVYWCYRCEMAWPAPGNDDDDEDDDGRGRKRHPPAPIRPIGWNPSPEWKESEGVIRKAMRKERVTEE